MPTGSVPFMRRTTPVLPLLEASGELDIVDTAKTVTVTTSADLVFGVVAVATDATVDIEYTSTMLEDFVMGAGFLYEGDVGAFTVKADTYGTYTAPVALTDGLLLFFPIPPDTYGTPATLTITALAADNGVAKAGTIKIIDRMNFADSAAPLRILSTLTLSKTYTP